MRYRITDCCVLAGSGAIYGCRDSGVLQEFQPDQDQCRRTSVLTFTIINADTAAASGLAFTDTLTGGLLVASSPSLSNTCGGTVAASANTALISLSNGIVHAPAGTGCTISVNVVGTSEGVITNTTSTLTSTNEPTAPAATATITVGLPPLISKAFGAVAIPLGSSTSLTFTITNPNASLALTGVAFTDRLHFPKTP